MSELSEADDATLKAFFQTKTAVTKMGRSGDEGGTIIVLKGHLILEELIRTKLDGYLLNPEYIKRANLGFFQILCVARAVYPVGVMNYKLPSIDEVDGWDLIDAWNTLRNKLAHRFEPDYSQEIIRKIIFFRPNWEHPLEHDLTQIMLGGVLGHLISCLGNLPSASTPPHP